MINNTLLSMFAGFLAISILMIVLSPFILASDLTREVIVKVKERQSLIERLSNL